MLEWENPYRHSLEQIHIKRVDQIQPPLGLGARAGKHQQIAQIVHAHQGVGRHHGLENGGHFCCADVLQWHHNGAIAGWQGPASGLANRATDSLEGIGPADMVGTARIAHQGQPVGLQCTFQQKNGAIGRNGSTGGKRHRAAQRGVQNIVRLQDVTKDGAHHICHRRLFEAEGNRSTFDRLARFCSRNHTVISANDARLSNGFGISCLALAVGLGGFHLWQRCRCGRCCRVCHEIGARHSSRLLRLYGRQLATCQRNSGECVSVMDHDYLLENEKIGRRLWFSAWFHQKRLLAGRGRHQRVQLRQSDHQEWLQEPLAIHRAAHYSARPDQGQAPLRCRW